MAGKSVGAAGHFGRQMRKERLAHGWSLPEFLARIGFDAGHLSRVENAKRPATEALAKACDAAFPDATTAGRRRPAPGHLFEEAGLRVAIDG